MANPKIIRREPKDYGGEEIWVEGDPVPFYAGPGVNANMPWLRESIDIRQGRAEVKEVDHLYNELAGRPPSKVFRKMDAEKTRLGLTEYAKKTKEEVEADVNSLDNLFGASG